MVVSLPSMHTIINHLFIRRCMTHLHSDVAATVPLASTCTCKAALRSCSAFTCCTSKPVAPSSQSALWSMLARSSPTRLSAARAARATRLVLEQPSDFNSAMGCLVSKWSGMLAAGVAVPSGSSRLDWCSHCLASLEYFCSCLDANFLTA